MQYEHIIDDRQLVDFCRSVAAAKTIAFDTEFVSEDTYRPELCLIQVAADEHLAVVDSLAVKDLTPYWELLAAPGHTTVVHAGREEFRFCQFAIDRRPHELFDVQIAAALVGLEYPASYNSLLARLLGKTLEKGETRTDWRRRPLTSQQMEYALQDVLHLAALRDVIADKLEQLGRREWLTAEMTLWQQELEDFELSERWRRTSGIAGLSPRMLAIVRELWLWRDAEAERRNWPPKRILRDDLIVELARRQSADPKRIGAVRGMERGDIQRHMPQLIRCAAHALALPPDEWPRPASRSGRPQLNVLGQFLNSALGSICRAAQVSPSLVGSVDDVRDLIAHRLGLAGSDDNGTPPSLATGWRAEVVGHVIDELLTGKLQIRIADPLSDEPLAFVPAHAPRTAT